MLQAWGTVASIPHQSAETHLAAAHGQEVHSAHWGGDAVFHTEVSAPQSLFALTKVSTCEPHSFTDPKANLCLCSIKAPWIRMGGAEVQIYVRILNFGTRWRMASFTPRPPKSQVKSPRYSLDRRQMGPRADLDAVKKTKIFCPYLKKKPRSLGHITRNLATILFQLPGLHRTALKLKLINNSGRWIYAHTYQVSCGRINH
jgi:hypothetical protein